MEFKVYKRSYWIVNVNSSGEQIENWDIVPVVVGTNDKWHPSGPPGRVNQQYSETKAGKGIDSH